MTLIKCTQLAVFPEAMSEKRRNGIQVRFEDGRAVRTTGKLQSIQLEAQHDDVNDIQHVGKVTDMLREASDKMR